MPRRKRRKYRPDQLTTIVARAGRRVHAVALAAPADTACGQAIATRSWRLVPRSISCKRCIAAIFYPVRPETPARVPAGGGRRR